MADRAEPGETDEADVTDGDQPDQRLPLLPFLTATATAIAASFAPTGLSPPAGHHRSHVGF